MNEDFSDVLSKFSSILKEKDIDLNNIVGGMAPPTDFDEKNFNDIPNNESSDFNLDINTILKIKEIISSINKNNHSPRNTLLHALKPYLEESKKEKLEQYMKIANLLSVLENLDNNSKIKFSENNYDFVLILTLFLLLF